MKNLNFQAISEAAKTFQPTKNDSYLVSYPHFLAYFKALDEIQLPHLVIASHFVYGWMPTILNLDLSKKEEVLGLLNKVKNEDYALGGKGFKSKWRTAEIPKRSRIIATKLDLPIP
jgi:hypothetical protein